MKYILIKLTNGKWIKILSKNIVTVCEAETNNRNEIHLKRYLYSNTEDNTTIDGKKKKIWVMRRCDEDGNNLQKIKLTKDERQR